MICGVHAIIGAVLGKSLKKQEQAFLAGVASHVVADFIPHKDLTPESEVSLVVAALALIGFSEGWKSPAFWGAIGATLPDLENAVSFLRKDYRCVFPTHTGRHGRKVEEVLSQIGIALLCLAALLSEEHYA
jgi:hypothetical protein